MIFDSVEKRNKGRRRLRYAFAASLLAHLLLLWPRVSVVDVKDTPAALHATIFDQTPAVPPAPTLPAPRRSLRPKPPATPLVPKHAVPPAPTFPAPPPQVAVPDPVPSRPQTSGAQRSTPTPMPVTAEKPASAPLDSPSAALPVRSAPTTAAPALGGTEGRAATPALSQDGLHRYRLALASQARRFKRYPAQARAMGWAGTATIRVDVDRDGRPRTALLVHSSGHETLDRAALALIDAGAPRTRLPDSLRGREFSVTLPVVFNLEDG